MESPIIGFVGLGNMGTPMAKRLAAAGFSLRVHDSDAGAVERFVGRCPVPVAAGPADLGRGSDVVITVLPTGAAVRQALLGEPEGAGENVLAGLAPGAVVIDMGSSEPLGTRRLGAALAARRVGLIDAPVSGGVRRAVDGTLTIMVGGETALIEDSLALLRAMGRDIRPTGDLGSGHAMKALNNYVSAAGIIAAAEALVAGKNFGLDPQVMLEILNTSSGRNNATENKFAQQVFSRDFASGFTMGLMVKDLETAQDLAAAGGLDLPFADQCVDLWRRALTRLGAGADHTEVVRLWEEEAGVTLVTKS